jgi:predicted nucleotidyltransferase
MNPARHEAALGEITEAVRDMPGLQSTIVFGSVARGDATEESDLDLFLECDRGAEERIWRRLLDIGRRHDVPITPVFYRESERGGFDLQFLESIHRHGRVLLGRLPALTPGELDLRPMRLVSYWTPRLSARRRARLLRRLDGYHTAKQVGRRRYRSVQTGFLEGAGGWRVGRGALVVPEKAVRELEGIFQEFRVKRALVPVWIQGP